MRVGWQVPEVWGPQLDSQGGPRPSPSPPQLGPSGPLSLNCSFTWGFCLCPAPFLPLSRNLRIHLGPVTATAILQLLTVLRSPGRGPGRASPRLRKTSRAQWAPCLCAGPGLAWLGPHHSHRCRPGTVVCAGETLEPIYATHPVCP